MVTSDERDGVIEIAGAIGEAYQRARHRGKEDDIYKWMISTRIIGAPLPLVKGLMDDKKSSFDSSFQPGVWYATSKFSGGRDPDRFKKLVQRVENQTDGFRWSSWQQVDG